MFFYSPGFALPSSGFTHNDSLRGSDNPAKHYDVTYYRLHLQIEPAKKKINGANEIFFAVVSTSLTLAIVFIPIIFLQGFTGRLFREFGIVMAGAVLISAFVLIVLC